MLDQQNYKRFIYTFSLLMLVGFVALWGWAITGRMWYMDSEYPLWLYKKNQLTGACFENKIVILGDSRPMADLIPEEIGENVINLAIGGVTPIELYYTALMMRHCTKPPKAVVISMAPFHYMVMESYWGRTLPLQFLTFTQALEVQAIAQSDLNQKIYATSITGRIHDFVMNAVISYSFPTFYYTKLIDGLFHPNLRMNRISMKDLEDHRGHVAMHKEVRVTQPSAEVSMGKFHPLKLLDIYMRMALDEFHNMGAAIYYLDMPITPLTNDGLPENYRQDYDAYLTDILKPYDKAYRIGSLLPVHDLQDFSDPFHLNYNGAVPFSRSVRGEFPE